RAVLDGRLENAPMRKDANFGFLVPESAADVPADVLDPRASWANKKAYDETARGLTRDFEQNFGKYEPNVDAEIRKEAIRAAAEAPIVPPRHSIRPGRAARLAGRCRKADASEHKVDGLAVG